GERRVSDRRAVVVEDAEAVRRREHAEPGDDEERDRAHERLRRPVPHSHPPPELGRSERGRQRRSDHDRAVQVRPEREEREGKDDPARRPAALGEEQEEEQDEEELRERLRAHEGAREEERRKRDQRNSRRRPAAPPRRDEAERERDQEER